MDPGILAKLEGEASKLGLDISSSEFASAMDAEDPVRSLRHSFHYPKMKDLPEGIVGWELIEMIAAFPISEFQRSIGSSVSLQLT